MRLDLLGAEGKGLGDGLEGFTDTSCAHHLSTVKGPSNKS